MHLEIISRKPVTKPKPTSIVFVHGAWHAAWCWDEHFLPYFAGQGYECHALSLRGHGASEGREHLRFTRIAHYVTDLAQVVEGLERPPVLVGHSMGGLVVQKYLETHPAPAGVLLAAVPPFGVLPATLRIAMRYPLAFLKANLTMRLYPIVATPARAREAFFSADMPAEQVAAYHARLQDESYFAFLDMILFNLPRPRRVQAPMLVLGAADDTLFRPAQVEATARAYHTQAEIFPHMAHDMMLESNWENVATRIAAWLHAHDW